MTPYRGPRNWPDGQSSNTPSSASSFGFDVAAELSRMNHPTNWTKPTDVLALDRPVAYSTRADLRALPPDQDSPPRGVRFPMPSSAVDIGAERGRRRPVALCCIAFVAGWLLGRRL